LGGFSHTFSRSHVTESLFGSFKTLVGSFPGVGKKSNGFDGGTISSGQVVGLIVVEDTAKTSSLTHQSFVDFDEDRFIAVPFQSPRVGDFFDNQVIGNSGDVHGEEVGWNGDKFTFKSGGDWFTIFVFGQSDSGIGDVDVDGSRAFGFTFTSGIVDDFDGEGAGENVFHESVRAVSLESENFTIKSSVVVLTPGHTVTSLFWVDLTFVHYSKNFSKFVFIDNFSFLDAFWEVWVWVPFAFGARVKSGHWNSGSKFVAFFTSWKTSELTFVVFTRNFTVDWSIEMLAFVGVRNTRWESVSTSWQGWLVLTSFEVANKQVGGFGSVAFFASQSANFDSFVNLARNGTVNWVESTASISGGWNKRTGVAGFLFNSGHGTIFLWHESASSVHFEFITGSIFGNENFGVFDFDGDGFVVGEFGDDFFGSIGFNSFDESSDFIVVSQSDSDFFTFGGRSPEWNGWADSSPGIGKFSNIGNLVSIGVGDVVLSIGIKRTTNTGGGKVEFSSNQKSVFVEDESGLFEKINNNNGVILSVNFEGRGQFDGLFGFVKTIGSTVEDKSGGVALSISKSQSTSLFRTTVNNIITGSTIVIKTELVDV
jgi:hypothetical protein